MIVVSSLVLAVIGDPVAHSKSPALHRGFLNEAGLPGSYEAIRVTPEEVGQTLGRLYDRGFVGLNVTTPLKELVLAHAIAVDDLASELGAANTLTRMVEGGWNATNTDGIGARAALETLIGAPLSGRRILVLGAGPTGRAAVAALCRAEAEVTVWNRSEEKARALAARYDAAVFDGSAGAEFDAVFSSLPPDATIAERVLHAMLATSHILDANYSTRATLGATLGRPVEQGETMLAMQARASFDIWRHSCDIR